MTHRIKIPFMMKWMNISIKPFSAIWKIFYSLFPSLNLFNYPFSSLEESWVMIHGLWIIAYESLVMAYGLQSTQDEKTIPFRGKEFVFRMCISSLIVLDFDSGRIVVYSVSFWKNRVQILFSLFPKWNCMNEPPDSSNMIRTILIREIL